MAFLSFEIIRDKNKKVCRGCMKQIDLQIPLSNKEDNKTFKEIMELMTGMRSTADSSLYLPLLLPNSLCVDCTVALKSFHKAREMFIASSRHFAQQYMDLRLNEVGSDLVNEVRKAVEKEIINTMGEVAIPVSSSTSATDTAAVPNGVITNGAIPNGLIQNGPTSAQMDVSTVVIKQERITDNPAPRATPPTVIDRISLTPSPALSRTQPLTLSTSDARVASVSNSSVSATTPSTNTVATVTSTSTTTATPMKETKFIPPPSRPIASNLPLSLLQDNPGTCWECNKCLRKFSGHESFTHHYNACHRDNPVKCILCGKKFKSLPYLANHISKNHLVDGNENVVNGVNENSTSNEEHSFRSPRPLSGSRMSKSPGRASTSSTSKTPTRASGSRRSKSPIPSSSTWNSTRSPEPSSSSRASTRSPSTNTNKKPHNVQRGLSNDDSQIVRTGAPARRTTRFQSLVMPPKRRRSPSPFVPEESDESDEDDDEEEEYESPSGDSLQDFIVDDKEAEDTEEEDYECPDCSGIFKSRTSLNMHIGQKHKDKQKSKSSKFCHSFSLITELTEAKYLLFNLNNIGI